MSEKGFRVYPSGFAVRDDKFSQAIVMDGDLEITHLFEHYRDGTHTPLEFDYFMKVINKALDLLSVDANWVITQSFNPNLSKAKVGFLIDTINYLLTGRRSQSMTTWRAVCCDDAVSNAKGISLKGFSLHKEIVLPKKILFGQPASIISTWLSHNGGFADLVESLQLMFGTQEAFVR